MTDDPKIAAMFAATEFATNFLPSELTAKDVDYALTTMFDLADQWLSWYDRMVRDERGLHIVAPLPSEDRQPCGAFREPQWYSELPEAARKAFPWFECSGEHDEKGWHQTAPEGDSAGRLTFATHHHVGAWPAAGYLNDYPFGRCSCGKAWDGEH